MSPQNGPPRLETTRTGPTPCRSSLGRLHCERDGGHPGRHRQGDTSWAASADMPAWLRRARLSPNGLTKDYTGKVGVA